MTDGSGGSAPADETGSVLVLAPEIRDAGTRICTELLAGAERSVDHVVPVTVGQSPEDWIDIWTSGNGGRTERITCVDVDRLTRSASAATASPSGTVPVLGDERDVTVERVTDLSDLTALGIEITDAIYEADVAGDRVGVAVHSLTDLLQCVDRQQAFFFVITLADRVRRQGGVAYFHLDRNSHDETTVDVFETACDAVFEPEENVGLEL